MLTLTLPPLQGAGFWVAFWQVAAVYYGFAALIHWVVPALFSVETVQVGKRRPGQVKKEALLSVGPIAVKALVFTVVEHLSRRPGFTKLYSGPIEGVKGWCYLLFTVAALDALHDAWFYFTHRWMHSWRFLYKHVHSLHHESTVPTAFTGYAFHPIEGVIVFANEILVTFLFPIHTGLHRAYHLWTTVIHNGGHAGYEIAPFIPSLAAAGAAAVEAVDSLVAGMRRRRRSRGRGREEENVDDVDDVDVKKRRHRQPSSTSTSASAAKAARAALNTVRHHDMHHRFPFAHFSLYFTHWDRLLGTEHRGYRAAVEAHFSKKKTKEEKTAVKEEEEEEEEIVSAAAAADAADSAREERRGGELPSSTSSFSSSDVTRRRREVLERHESAMEEHGGLASKKAKGTTKKKRSDNGDSSSGSGSDVTSSKKQQQQQRLRPHSPAIGAYWEGGGGAAAAGGRGSSSSDGGVKRRSSRLARAA